MNREMFSQKIRDFFTKDVRRIYMSAGIGCLVLAAAVVIGILSTSSKAETESISLSCNDYTLNVADEGGTTYYLIDQGTKGSEELQALFGAQEYETLGKHFRLTGDIEIDKVTDLSSGEFAGELDGCGYVLTLKNIDIDSTGYEGYTENLGILFGNITSDGKVTNLIINLPNGGNVTRTSQIKTEVSENITEDSTSDVVWNDSSKTPDGDAVLVYYKVDSDGNTEYDADGNPQYVDYSTFASDAEAETAGYIKAYKQDYVITGTKTVTASLVDENNYDSFGILCGNNAGEISEVYITGDNSFTVTGVNNGSQSSSTEYTASKTDAYFYEAVDDVPEGSITLSSSKTTASNNYISGNLEISKVPETGTGKSGKYYYVYKLILKNANSNSSDQDYDSSILISDISTTTKRITASSEEKIIWKLKAAYTDTLNNVYAAGEDISNVKYNGTDSGVLLGKGESIELYCEILECTLEEMLPDITVNVSSTTITTVNFGAKLGSSCTYVENGKSTTVNGTAELNLTTDYLANSTYSNSVSAGSDASGYTASVNLPNANGGTVTATLSVPQRSSNEYNGDYLVSVNLKNVTSDKLTFYVSNDWSADSTVKTTAYWNYNSYQTIELEAGTSVDLYKFFSNYGESQNASITIKGLDVTKNKPVGYDYQTVASADKEVSVIDGNNLTGIDSNKYTLEDTGHLISTLYVPSANMDSYTWTYTVENNDTLHSYNFSLGNTTIRGTEYTWTPVSGNKADTYTIGKATTEINASGNTVVKNACMSFTITVVQNELDKAGLTAPGAPSVTNISIATDASENLSVAISDDYTTNKIFDFYSWEIKNTYGAEITLNFSDTYKVYDADQNQLTSKTLASAEKITLYAYNYNNFTDYACIASLVVVDPMSLSGDTMTVYNGFGFYLSGRKITYKITNISGKDLTLNFSESTAVYDSSDKNVAGKSMTLESNGSINVYSYATMSTYGNVTSISYTDAGGTTQSVTGTSMGDYLKADETIEYLYNKENSFYTYSKDVTITMKDTTYYIYLDLGAVAKINAQADGYTGKKTGEERYLKSDYTSGGWYNSDSSASIEQFNGNFYLCVEPVSGSDKNVITLKYVSTSDSFTELSAEKLKNIIYKREETYTRHLTYGSGVCSLTDSVKTDKELNKSADYVCKLSLQYKTDENSTPTQLSITNLNSWSDNNKADNAINSSVILNQQQTTKDLYLKVTGYDNAVKLTATPTYTYPAFYNLSFVPDNYTSGSEGYTAEGTFKGYDSGSLKDFVGYKFERPYELYSDTVTIKNNSSDNVVITQFSDWYYINNGEKVDKPKDDILATVEVGNSVTFIRKIYGYDDAKKALASFSGYYVASVTNTFSGPINVAVAGSEVQHTDGVETVTSSNDETLTDGQSCRSQKIGLETVCDYDDCTDYIYKYEMLLACAGAYGLSNIEISTNDESQTSWSNVSKTLAADGIIITNASFSDEEAKQGEGSTARKVTVNYTIDSVSTVKGGAIGTFINVKSAKIDINSGKNSTATLKQGGFALHAGGVVGDNNGTITKIKYSLPFTAKFDTTNDNEKTVLGVSGNIAATANSTSIDNVYMTVSGDYVGSNTSLNPSCSLCSASAVTSLNFDSSAWGQYIISSASDSIKYYDLAWLIREYKFDGAGTMTDVTDKFTAGKIDSQQIKISAATSDRSITQGSSVYNARKSMSDTSEDTVFYSRRGAADSDLVISLEESAYYRIVNIYQTDGYYHYFYYAGNKDDSLKTALKSATYYYPYMDTEDLDENPYSQEALGTGWTSVKRSISTGNVQDIIEFTMPRYNGSTFSGYLYYTAVSDASSTDIPDASNSLAVDSQGKTSMAYGGENVVYRITPYENSHIYPTVSTVEFTASNLAQLPKPVVSYTGHFDSTGSSLSEKEISDDGADILFAGDTIKFSVKGGSGDDYVSAYSIKYILSSTLCSDSDISSLDWSGAPSYVGAVTVPESLIGTEKVYVYVQIGKGSYNPSYYNCGSFYVTQGSVVSKVYATSEASAVEITGNCLTGDIFRLIAGNYNGCDREYAFSSSEVNSLDSLSWNTYSDNSVVLLDSAKPYVYMRVKAANSNYGPVSRATYTFGTEAGSVRANPNAADESNPIQNGTLCLLTSYTNEADIYYIYAKAKDITAAPKLERVSKVSEGTVSGVVAADGYMYIKSGERWYRTSSELIKYSSGVSLTNDTSDVLNYCLYACSVAEDYTPGEFKCFSFYVTEMDQVCAPEASIPTKSNPAGKTDTEAVVSLGDTVSFTSATPSNGNNKVSYKYSLDSGYTWSDVPETGVEVTGKYGGEFTIDVYATREGMLDSDPVRFIYSIKKQGQVESLSSTPSTSDTNPTEVRPGDRILLSTTTSGATIIYTTDETTPKYTVTYADDGSVRYELSGTTMLYSAASGILMPERSSASDNYYSVYAIGIKDGLLDSELGRFTFAYPAQVGNPYANVAAGDVSLNTDIYLYSSTSDATICYTTAYGDDVPANPTISSMVFTGLTPITISQKTTIKAIAFKNGVTSNIVTFVYNPMTQLAPPSASISSGSVVSNGMSLKLSSGNATIFYTLDGSDPTDSSNTAVVSGNNVTLSGSAGQMIVVKAYASQSNYSNSETVTFTYQISDANGGITADIPSGSDVSSGTKVNLMTDVTGASIYYVVGNGDPAKEGILGNTVTITGSSGESIMVKAVTVTGGSYGTVTTFVYHILEKPSEPVAYPSGGELTTAKYVILSSEAGDIYYTVDGSTPTASSTLYTDPFLVNKTTTVKAIAVLENGEVSDVATFAYVAALKAQAPVFSEENDAVIEPGTIVYINSETRDAVIYYSLDGSEPDADNIDKLSAYDSESGIQVSRSVTIKAIAYRSDLQISDVVECNLIVETIPGQEIKEAEEAAEEASKLHDSDTSGLDRNSLESEESLEITLKEDVCNTTLSGSGDILSESMSIETEKLGEVSKTIKNNVSYYYGDEYSVLSLYDTYLVSDDTHIEPDGEVEIGIPIPDGFENATLSLVHIDENGRITPLQTRRQDNMLYATVSELNLYGVVGIESEKTSVFSFPILLVLEIATGLVVCGGVVFVIVKKVQKNRKERR